MKIYPKNLHSLKKNQMVYFDNQKKLKLNVSCSWMSASIKRVTHIKKTTTYKNIQCAICCFHKMSFVCFACSCSLKCAKKGKANASTS